MKLIYTTYVFTFDKILRGGKKQMFLDFPGRYGSYNGPFKDRQEAWNMYVRIARECYFVDDPEKPIVYREGIPERIPFVPATDYQI